MEEGGGSARQRVVIELVGSATREMRMWVGSSDLPRAAGGPLAPASWPASSRWQAWELLDGASLPERERTTRASAARYRGTGVDLAGSGARLRERTASTPRGRWRPDPWFVAAPMVVAAVSGG